MVTELVQMAGLELVKDTFIAVDVYNPEDGSDEQSSVRFVGTVVGYEPSAEHPDKPELGTLRLQDPDDETNVREIFVNDIKQGWWAPMGYRP